MQSAACEDTVSQVSQNVWKKLLGVFLTGFKLTFSTGCDNRDSKGTRPEGKDRATLRSWHWRILNHLEEAQPGDGMAIRHDAFQSGEHLGDVLRPE